MNSRERVLKSLRHEELDRVPLDFTPDPRSSLVTDRLLAKLGLRTSHDLLDYLHIDLRHVAVPYFEGYERTLDGGTREDIFGIHRHPEGYVCFHPLGEATSVRDVNAHLWPDPDAVDYEHYADLCGQHEGYAVVGGPEARPFFDAVEMLGMQKMFMAMIETPDLVHAVLERLTDYYYTVSKRAFERVRGKLDVVWMISDFGSQESLLISLPMWREFARPYFQRLVTLAKENGFFVVLHSDGAIRPVVQDLIDIGVDCINPVQVRAKGMNPAALKHDFGERLSFHGAIDVQHTLPFGSEEDVRVEVLERLRTLGPGGGYILSCSHTLLDDVPVENILTMYKTGYDYGWYPNPGYQRA